MFRKLKTLFETFTNVWVVIDRLEHNMVLQDRKIKLIEQKQDELFEKAVSFIRKQQALDEENVDKQRPKS